MGQDPPGETPRHVHSGRWDQPQRGSTQRTKPAAVQRPSVASNNQVGPPHNSNQPQPFQQQQQEEDASLEDAKPSARHGSDNSGVGLRGSYYSMTDPSKTRETSRHSLQPPAAISHNNKTSSSLLSKHLEQSQLTQSAPATVLQDIVDQHGCPEFKDQVRSSPRSSSTNNKRDEHTTNDDTQHAQVTQISTTTSSRHNGPHYKDQMQSVIVGSDDSYASTRASARRSHGPHYKDQMQSVAEEQTLYATSATSSGSEAVNLHELRSHTPPPRGIDPGLPQFKDQVMDPHSTIAAVSVNRDDHAHRRSETAPTLRSPETEAPIVTAALIQPLERGSSVSNNNNMSIIDSIASNQELPEEAMSVLINQGFPLGLIRELQTMKYKFPLRFIIVDNSGSMLNIDSSKLIENDGKYFSRACSRWTELKSCVEIIGELAGALSAKTIFRLLNDPLGNAPREITVKDADDAAQLNYLLSQIQPEGGTPLTAHLAEIRQRIENKQDELRRCGQKAVVVIATDGIPSNGFGESPQAVKDEFVASLRSLQVLPVWIVVRLCTNHKETIKYYRDLDEQLELPIEVLDDFRHEAKEVAKVNRWLNYAYPLHLCREMGYHHRVFDLLDERTLDLEELELFMQVIFGDAMARAPDVYEDWKAYWSFLSTVNSNERPQFNAIAQKSCEWIDMRKLNDTYGAGLMSFMRKKLSEMSIPSVKR